MRRDITAKHDIADPTERDDTHLFADVRRRMAGHPSLVTGSQKVERGELSPVRCQTKCDHTRLEAGLKILVLSEVDYCRPYWT